MQSGVRACVCAREQRLQGFCMPPEPAVHGPEHESYWQAGYTGRAGHARTDFWGGIHSHFLTVLMLGRTWPGAPRPTFTPSGTSGSKPVDSSQLWPWIEFYPLAFDYTIRLYFFNTYYFYAHGLIQYCVCLMCVFLQKIEICLISMISNKCLYFLLFRFFIYFFFISLISRKCCHFCKVLQ